MKIYAGAPAAARHYMEADRGRADDYYLIEGTGLARRYTATDGRVTELAPLTGDTYENWVAGRDPETGEPKGQLRGDEHAVRFAEVVVNGPKTSGSTHSTASAPLAHEAGSELPSSGAHRNPQNAECTHRRTGDRRQAGPGRCSRQR